MSNPIYVETAGRIPTKLDSEKKRHEYTKANLSGAQTLLNEANNAVGRFRRAIFRRAMAAIGKVAEIAF